MPHEVISIQVGQCGNQIGWRFWDMAHAELARAGGVIDDAASTFFRAEERSGAPRARAVLVDMERGVVNETLRGPVGHLFDDVQVVADVSGSGNNFSTGWHVYGDLHGPELAERVRREAERCDSLQAFMFSLSTGGGTGSGFGTRAMAILGDAFPKVDIFAAAVLPSEDDDVVTSPYNAEFATAKMVEHADCILPMSNDALGDICDRIEEAEDRLLARSGRASLSSRSSLSSRRRERRQTEEATGKKQKPFDKMNTIAATLLLDLTSSARFPGQLNMDISEITMNLVPFPGMQVLVSALAPYPTLSDELAPKNLDGMFRDSFSPDFQLLRADPKVGTYLSCALAVRGAVGMSEIRRNIDKSRQGLNFVWWNFDGWKVGHCSVPPPGQSKSVLCLANNSCIGDSLAVHHGRFSKLYRRKAHFHHYLQNMEQTEVDQSALLMEDTIARYQSIPTDIPPSSGIPRDVIVV